jgi:hypothetical protein
MGLRWVAADELGLGSARSAAFEMRASRRLGARLDLSLAYRHLAGKADGDAIDLSGKQVIGILAMVF